MALLNDNNGDNNGDNNNNNNDDDDHSDYENELEETASVPLTPTTSIRDRKFLQHQQSLRHQHSKTTSSKNGVLFPQGSDATSTKQLIQEKRVRGVLFPWSKNYQAWWGFTVFGAIMTVFSETYQIAFAPAGLYPYDDGASIVEYVLVSIFVVDIVVNFHLAYFDEADDIVFDKKRIAIHYLSFMFWIDLIGVFPFYAVALAMAGQLGQDTKLASYLALVRLVRLVRLHRVKQLFDNLQYNTSVSFMSLTLLRNFCFALVWTHWSACVIYFIARHYNFDPDRTFIGGSYEDSNAFERYLTSLYWSVVTFTTVGYGDYSPVNAVEQFWGIVFMLLNMIVQAWFVGSITLLIVKQDEKTGEYREGILTLQKYSAMHKFDRLLEKSLETQLKLEFNNRELGDEQVLQRFPTAVRRKVLRRLYLPSLIQTSLMRGIRQQFVDAFLTTCCVEIFSPGEEILQRGSISSDLYLLVGGVVKLLSYDDHPITDTTTTTTTSSQAYGSPRRTGASVADSVLNGTHGGTSSRELEAGEFINEIGFFTESPQIDTVVTKTVCKTLTMSRSAYKMIAEDHPGSVGKILANLLAKTEAMATDTGTVPTVDLPKRMDILRAGSVFDTEGVVGGGPMNDSSYRTEVQSTVRAVQKEKAIATVKDLIKMHMNKQKDDYTTRFLFAASRGDTSTISLMCDHGLDPNTADYDSRTGLMVAAMKGNVEAVEKLLECHANPNLVDMHGSSALYEAVSNGHEPTMAILMEHGAVLGMEEGQAASVLCKAVFDGDVLILRRLLRAKIPVNASDYDKRTAAHIAAAEGNVAALKVLVEFGADLTVPDRWKNTVDDEAKQCNATPLLEYLEELRASGYLTPTPITTTTTTMNP